MSKSLGTLTLDLVAKTGGFVAGMTKAERESAKFKRKVKKELDEVGVALKRLTAVGIAGLTVGMAAVVKASARQEDAIAQLEQRLKSTGGVAGRTSKQLQEFASSMQKVTTFGDEAVMELQSILLTFTSIRGEIFDRTVPAVLDLSVAMGQDLKSSALQLGKALNDPIANLGALSRTGIQFSESQKETIKTLAETGRLAEAQSIILQELQVQFGGAAEAAAKTFSGSLKQVQNAFGDLLENPSGLNANAAALRELTAFLQDPETVQAANALTSALINGFSAVAFAVRDTIGVMQFLGEEFARIRFGVASDDFVRLNEELQKARDLLNKGPLDRLRFFGPGGVVEYWSDDELKAEIARLEKAIEAELTRLTKSGSPPPISAPVASVVGLQADTPVARVLDTLKEIEVTAARIAADDNVLALASKQSAANAGIQSVSDSLATEEELIRQSYERRKQIILDNTLVTGEAQKELLTRLTEQTNEQLNELNMGFWDKYLESLEEQFMSMDELTANMLDNLTSRFGDAFESMIFDSESLGDAVYKLADGMLRSIVNALGQMAAQWLAYQAVQLVAGQSTQAAVAASSAATGAAIATAYAPAAAMASLASFGANAAPAMAGISATAALSNGLALVGMAHDGIDSVPQTGTWLLQKGERVTTADTSAKLDRTLSNIQGGGMGGNIRIVNAWDSSMIGDYMGSSAGEKVIMNAVKRNQRTIRSLAS